MITYTSIGSDDWGVDPSGVEMREFRVDCSMIDVLSILFLITTRKVGWG